MQRTFRHLFVALLVFATAVGYAHPVLALFGLVAGYGGSRLIYYYRQASFTPGGAGLTVFTVSNNRGGLLSVKFVIYNGADCAKAGPFTVALKPGETKILSVANFVPAAAFPSGVIDLWAIENGQGQPIHWDWLTGTSIVVDQGAGPIAATTVPAEKFFSPDRTTPGELIGAAGYTSTIPLKARA